MTVWRSGFVLEVGFGLLPIRPIWPGFLINTLFYAAILWLIFAGPFALRRTIRRRRGCCPACGYPVGVSPRCTECGAEVVPNTSTSTPQQGDGV